MKEKWLIASGSWEEIKPRITTALESGFDCVLVDNENIDRVRELGKIKVACFGADRGKEDILVIGKGGEGDGTVPLPKDQSSSIDSALSKTTTGEKAAYVVIANKRYEEFAVEMGKNVDYLLVIGTDWKVIPLENMIAGLQGVRVKIVSGVKTAEEAKLALATLEKGADGVLLDSLDLSEIKRVMNAVEQSEKGRLELIMASVTSVKPVGMGDRVCVDTASPYVAARPFRVNAGAVHAYIRVGEKTRYLSELKSGDEVTIVSKDGLARSAIVGRSKIEKRPMILIEAEAKGERISTLLQNAETIKLVGADGIPRPVTELKAGDEVLVHLEETARHFGMKIEESIVEK
jgi:3-dehydroquinate synthase II